MSLAREGREAAFEEIVRRYRPSLVAFAAAYGPPDPEDVVQESLVRSWGALRESSGKMHLKAWLYTIVRNRALNAKRDDRPHAELPDDLDGVAQPADIVLTNDELRRAVDAVGELPGAQREALVRSALEGQTHDQIAAAIGATPGAVRQLIYRARLTVRHGVGALIPLPLVRTLLEHSAAGEAAAGPRPRAGSPRPAPAAGSRSPARQRSWQRSAWSRRAPGWRSSAPPTRAGRIARSSPRVPAGRRVMPARAARRPRWPRRRPVRSATTVAAPARASRATTTAATAVPAQTTAGARGRAGRIRVRRFERPWLRRRRGYVHRQLRLGLD